MYSKLIGQFVATINHNLVPMVIIKDMRIIVANEIMHRLLGYGPNELIEQDIRQLFLDQGSYAAFEAEMSLVIAEGGHYNGIIAQKCQDGSTLWCEFNISSIEGCPDALMAAIVDRTPRYHTLQQLTESELRYRSVVEDQTEVIARFLPNDTFVFVNAAFCRLFGRSAAELIGHCWQPVVHPDDLPNVLAELHKITPENPVVTIENRVCLANGEIRWMQFVNRGLFDADRNLKETQAVGRDITKLKAIELKLRESDERLELALKGSGLVLWDWNIHEQTVTVGSRLVEVLGYSNEELGYSEEAWFNLIKPCEQERVKQETSSHFLGETASLESEYQLRHKDGHWVTLEFKGKVTSRDEGNKPLRMVGTMLDITQRKRLNEESMDLLKRIELLIREYSLPSPTTTEKDNTIQSLTKRQRQIIGMIAAGMTSPEIAKQLHLATETVFSHRRNLMVKLNFRSTAEITRFAIENGLLAPK